jgi:hypothetical protein
MEDGVQVGGGGEFLRFRHTASCKVNTACKRYIIRARERTVRTHCVVLNVTEFRHIQKGLL